jgi:hypothetical protein
MYFEHLYDLIEQIRTSPFVDGIIDTGGNVSFESLYAISRIYMQRLIPNITVERRARSRS